MSIDYSAVLADLVARRAKLSAAIEAITEIMAEPPRTDLIANAAQQIQQRQAQLRSGTVAGLSYELIRAHGGPMRVTAIVKALQGMGKFKSVDARSNYGTVYGTLKADTRRFVKAGEGAFDIAERDNAA